MISSYSFWANLFLYCDIPLFSIVWKLVLYHVEGTNWWLLIWPPKIVSTIYGSYYSIIIELFFFSQWKQWVVALTALSALVAPLVVNMANYGAADNGGVYRLNDPCFQCSFNMIFTLDFTVICTSMKCICYFSFVHLFYYAWLSSLPYYHRTIFLTEGRRSSIWRLCRRLWHRELMAGLALFCSRCSK